MNLRPYQYDAVTDVYDAWNNGARNVAMVMPTGAGKGECICHIVREHVGASCTIAHRQELVSDLSMRFARSGVYHNVIASDSVRRAIARMHVEEFGRLYYQPGAPHAIAGVDTLIRASGLDAWAKQVTRWTCDEGHHLIVDNKWHRAISLFPETAHGLAPTATPERADGKGLGRHADGVIDVMVEGPPMRWLIEQGFLSDYRIVCPTSDMAKLAAEMQPGASGDLSNQQLRDLSHKSRIIGDVVREYKKWASGMLGITFCTDVETAEETAYLFNAAGVAATALSGKTPDYERRQILRRFERREILQLCTVDIVSEGFDLPALEVASMARPTHSLALYRQQFGRALRTFPGKGKALIIDHAGNVVRHNLPDSTRVWSLDRRGGKRRPRDPDALQLRVCVECFQPYEAYLRACRWCGHAPEPQGRASPAQVDGDLAELDAATLAQLRGDVAAIDMDESAYRRQQIDTGALPLWVDRHVVNHRNDQAMQTALRESMARWGGYRRAEGLSIADIQRLFYRTFGLDVLSAQALRFREANDLRMRIDEAVNGR